MRRFIVPLLMVFALAGCTLGEQVGKFSEPEAPPRKILEGAVNELHDRPILRYEGAIDNVSAAGNATAVKWEVTRDGTAYGTAQIGDYDVEFLNVDGNLYILASADFWEEQGVDSKHAKRIGDSWTQVDPEDWFDPGAMLRPGDFAVMLWNLLQAAEAPETALPEPEDIDGVQAYPVPLGDGFVYISVEDGTVVKLVDVEFDIDGSTLTISVDVYATDAEAVEQLQSDIADALEKMTDIYDDGAELYLTMGALEFDCNDDASKCTLAAEVTADVSGTYLTADEVKVVFTGTVSNPDLGSDTCTKKKTLDAGETAEFSCSAGLNLPADGQLYSIDGVAEAEGVAVFHPDVEAIAEKLASEFAKILQDL